MKYGLSDSMGREFEGALADGEGQGSLACCSPRGHKESEKTLGLNNNSVHSPKSVTHNIATEIAL